jgi:hypothetical protein
MAIKREAERNASFRFIANPETVKVNPSSEAEIALFLFLNLATKPGMLYHIPHPRTHMNKN